ncbi:hypothetical protein [Anoxybacteroides rupiense]|uniref:hypothetical protein n=1 Tax=Anoxybacteroides rupiense TaxID=311460 RepID=UPI0016065003|nr:hypothetical protein [Anoxybacillus rupiensis]MBB3908123.1 hypothetical protein [Anoxybacillus rupiensis]
MKETKTILMSDALVFSMPVEPSQEPFVDLAYFDPDIAVDPVFANRSDYFSFVSACR